MAVEADILAKWLDAIGTGSSRRSVSSYQGNGVTTSFNFNFAGGYINVADIVAYVYDDTTHISTPWTPVFTGANTVQYTPALPATKYLVIYRSTPIGSPLVDFVAGAPMTEKNLDDQAKQSTFSAAELVDRFDAVSDKTNTSLANANGAVTVANSATAAAAAATTTANTAASNAATALTTAGTASTNATTAVNTANTASTNASTALSTANTAKSTADAAAITAGNATTTANSATTTANSALTSAGTANTTAAGAVTTANNTISVANAANTTAGNAQTTANTASTNATNAVNTANSANTTAGTASTNASTALSTANTAKTTADTAKATADTALANAATATTTANTASGNASTALTTANTAKSTADTAKSTADTAKSTADSALAYTLTGVPANGNNTFTGTNSFTLPVTVATATAAGHAVTKAQLDAEASTRATNDTAEVNNRIADTATKLAKASNLSDVASVVTSRTNLSVYSQAETDAAYLKVANNLSEVPSKAAALTNLGTYSKTEEDARFLRKDVADTSAASLTATTSMITPVMQCPTALGGSYANTTWMQMSHNGATGIINAGRNGSGAYTPMQFYTSAVLAMQIEATGQVDVYNNFQIVGANRRIYSDFNTTTPNHGARTTFVSTAGTSTTLQVAPPGANTQCDMVLFGSGGFATCGFGQIQYDNNVGLNIVAGALAGGVNQPIYLQAMGNVRARFGYGVAIGPDSIFAGDAASANGRTAISCNDVNAPLMLRNSNTTSGKFWWNGPNSGNNFTIFNQNAAGTYIVDGGTAWNAQSDIRLKTDLAPITGALDFVESARTMTGRYKTDDADKSRLFFIAQDWQATYPQAVSENDGWLGMGYGETTPVLAAAIKELLAKVRVLEAQVEALTTK